MTNKQTILIAGATGNIGGGAAVALAKRGARVVVLGRKLERLEARADYIRAALSEAQIDYRETDIATLVIDFSDMESVRLAAAEAMNRFPKIHGLILSAVALVQDGPNVLPSGHELMFATNVMGPFLFTQLLIERMEQSNGLVLHVINLSYEKIDWDDLESIRNHKTETAYERTKMMHRVIAGELARRYAGRISSVAFDPSKSIKQIPVMFIIDKNDPELEKRWPSGFMGFYWKTLDLMLSYKDRSAINGAMFQLEKRVKKPDKAMNDEVLGKRLWDELVRLTGLTPE
jgi:NAD(P)-dependent dehydrogenase (short-subunit alcohol dehydrogenase family)